MTRECEYADLRPELHAAIKEHAHAELLDEVHTQPLVCIETESVRHARRTRFDFLGSLDSEGAIYTAAIVTSHWLVWALASAQRRAAFSARLDDIRVKEYDMKAMIEDDGVIITRQEPNAEDCSSAFLGLGPGEAADKFKQTLLEAVRDVP